MALAAACVVLGACDSGGQTAKEESTTAPSTAPSMSATSPSPPSSPPGFNAASVTFVSVTTGWVLGSATCGADPCVQVWRTGDGGRTWAAVPAPPAPAPLNTNAENPPLMRFADADDGWVAAEGKAWSTHDGGAHWNEQSIGSVYALEASGGTVHAVVNARDNDSFAFRVVSSPVHQDAWRPSEKTVPAGAGPVPRPQLVLHGRSGWMVIVNRVIVGGLRLQNGRWANWKPPCDDDGTPLRLAASTASDLVAFCADGVWNDKPRGDRVLVSADGGSSFRQVPVPSPLRDVHGAAAAHGVWLAAALENNAEGNPQAVLFRTTDAGRTWTGVHRDPKSGWIDLGLTSAKQGVAIIESNTDSTLFMTYDGGQTWTPAAPR